MLHADRHQWSIVGALQYLTMTRHDLPFTVQQACLHMHAPTTTHEGMVKRILRHVRGIAQLGLQLHRSSTLDLAAYSNADCARCPDTWRSTSAFSSATHWFLGPVSTKQQCQDQAWKLNTAELLTQCLSALDCNLLGELSSAPAKATVVFCDNISACYMSTNPVHHCRTKHIELDVHFVREKVAIGECRVLHVPTSQQFADVMTKGLPSPSYNEFRNSLCVSRPSDAHPAGVLAMYMYPRSVTLLLCS